MTAQKRKRTRITNTNDLYWGTQPTVPEKIDSKIKLINLLNWFNATKDLKQKKTVTLKVAKKIGFTDKRLNGISPQYFSSIGNLCFLIDLGCQIDVDLQEKLTELVNEGAQENEETAPVRAPAKRKPLKDDTNIVLAFDYVDTIVDDFILKGRVPAKIDHSAFAVLTKAEKDELQEYITIERSFLSDSELLKEGYALSNTQIKKLINLFDNLSTILGQKKPRKKRKTKPEVVVKKLNYMKSHPELGLNSIDPVKLIDSKMILVYNTKIRLFAVYHSQEYTTMTVKGSTLTGFDESKSHAKILRKPQDQLKKLSGTKASILREFKAIKATEKTLTGRINKDCIILKAW